VRIRLKPRWLEERKVYYASRPAPEYLQNGAGPELRVGEVFILRKAAASKQGVQKQTWQLAVQGYNISCQHTCGRGASIGSNQIPGWPWLRGRALLIFDPFLPALISLWVSLSVSVFQLKASRNTCRAVPMYGGQSWRVRGHGDPL
jgi:hypothetical protein